MRNPFFACAVLAAATFFAFAPGRHSPAPSTHAPADHRPSAPIDPVRIHDGLLTGTTSTDGTIRIYRGIPFAAPPIGALRWRAPQPVTPWQGTRKCDRFSASPMQPKPTPFGVYTSEFLIPEQPISEDCLYLNVWTGARAQGEHRPVLVYIYGGGFVSGGSACPIYDGVAMAGKGVVFVSINYRVGIFGFFSHPGLTAESGHRASGNYGLLDQIAALRWVKENIAAFGGDPANVTIAGQSAGSMSVSCLVASPLAAGLFHRAIGESAASILNIPGYIRTPALLQAERDGIKAAAQLKAADLASLRAIPAERLLTVNIPRGPVIDGYVLPAAPGDLFRRRQYNPCDLLTGWNEDDNFLGPPQTAIQFREQLKQQFGAAADSALLFYPATNDAVALRSQGNLSRDMLVGVQNYSWANLQSSDAQHHVYAYRFRRRPPAAGDFVKYGSFHTAEVPYAYDNLAFFHRSFEPVDHQLAAIMSSYWVNFARTGDPNGLGNPTGSGDPNSSGTPAWPAYREPDARSMILDETPHAAPLPDKAALDFVLRHLPNQ